MESLKDDIKRAMVGLRREASDYAHMLRDKDTEIRRIKRRLRLLARRGIILAPSTAQDYELQLKYFGMGRDEGLKTLIEIGELLWVFAPAVDALFSVQEKAHLLGVSHEWLRVLIDRCKEYKAPPAFIELIFVCSAEHRGNDHSIGLIRVDMPLRTALTCWMLTRQDSVRVASELATREMATGMPYRIRVDGQGARVVADLQLVSGGVESCDSCPQVGA